MKKRILFLENVAGVAGDMFSAAFVDAGLVSQEDLAQIPKILGLSDVFVEFSNPMKASMLTTHLDVKWTSESWKQQISADHSHDGKLLSSSPLALTAHLYKRVHSHSVVAGELHPKSHWHTHYLDLDRFLEQSKLEARVKEFARKVFKLIASAEARAHGMSIDEVAFHEVGAIDSILDVVMAATCLAKVSADTIYCTPLKFGRGVIQMQHGTHPIPAPASVRLGIGMPSAPIPQAISRENVELSTPTGIAILKAIEPLFTDAMPTGVLKSQGMGSGTMDLGSYPNVFRVCLLEDSRVAVANYEQDSVVEIACNIDDETSERTAWVMEKLFEMGALDVWMTPIVGKKSRAAVCLSLLVEPKDREKFADWLLRKSSTFGVRYQSWDRLKLSRRFEERKNEAGESVTYKVGTTRDGVVVKEKPEFESVRKVWDRSAD